MPVRLFEADELADVIVIAGPNGVGKTRLIARVLQLLRGDTYPTSPDAAAVIAATSTEEEQQWNKPFLDLSVETDLALYRSTLQANRRRRNWRSSILQFESNRTILNVQPFQFSWDITDPDEEVVGWDTGFNFWQNRWQDTLHSMFRMIEAQKQAIANRALQLRKDGRTEMNLGFADPMQPFKDVFFRLLGPKTLVDPSARRQTLEFSDGASNFDISQLSSGEREVVNIAFDFQLRRPLDSIVFFDEPELHLHPELSHRLIQTLQSIGERNQFVLSTHSPDIISGSLDKSVIFVSPARQAQGEFLNQALPVREDDDTNQALKLLGHSIGIVALGRKIVLVEGVTSSLDKETYGSILNERFPNLVLVPSGGRHQIESFETLRAQILDKTIWGVEFFMLCDQDTVPKDAASDPRFKTLSKYHLENYFLDEVVIAKVFSRMEPADSWLVDPVKIRKKLRDLASEEVSYAVALYTSAHLRRLVGNVDLMIKGATSLDLAPLKQKIEERAANEMDRVLKTLEPASVAQVAQDYYEQLRTSIDADDGNWARLMPAKALLAKFCSEAKIQTSRFKTMYIDAARQVDADPFADIVAIFEDFSILPSAT